jgi:hypothetical protein
MHSHSGGLLGTIILTIHSCDSHAHSPSIVGRSLLVLVITLSRLAFTWAIVHSDSHGLLLSCVASRTPRTLVILRGFSSFEWTPMDFCSHCYSRKHSTFRTLVDVCSLRLWHSCAPPRFVVFYSGSNRTLVQLIHSSGPCGIHHTAAPHSHGSLPRTLGSLIHSSRDPMPIVSATTDY